MKLLVLGGTRFVGPAIVEAALRRKFTVTLFNRGQTNPALFPELEKLRGDREKGDLAALKGRTWDAVVDTFVEKPSLVRAALDVLAQHTGQYVFVSSISAYADLSRAGVDEDGVLEKLADPASEDLGPGQENFGGLKVLCERVVSEVMDERGTIVRPHLIVGPGDRSDRLPYWVARVARGGEVLAPADPDQPVQFIDVRDLGEFVVRLVADGHGGTFNAAGPRGKLTFEELLHGCKLVAGSDTSFTWCSAEFLRDKGVAPWRELPLWPPRGSEGVHAVSNARALAHGLEFRPAADTLRDVLAVVRTRDPALAWRTGITAEREAALLAEWKKR